MFDLTPGEYRAERRRLFKLGVLPVKPVEWKSISPMSHSAWKWDNWYEDRALGRPGNTKRNWWNGKHSTKHHPMNICLMT